MEFSVRNSDRVPKLVTRFSKKMLVSSLAFVLGNGTVFVNLVYLYVMTTEI